MCGGLLYLAYRIEPHWVSKDGRRFLTTSEHIDRFGNVVGRRREVRGAFLADGGIVLSRRSLVAHDEAASGASGPSHLGRHAASELYVLSAVPPDPDGDLLALRVPSSSRLVAMLDALTPARRSRRPSCRQRSDTRSTKSAMGSPI